MDQGKTIKAHYAADIQASQREECTIAPASSEKQFSYDNVNYLLIINIREDKANAQTILYDKVLR